MLNFHFLLEIFCWLFLFLIYHFKVILPLYSLWRPHYLIYIAFWLNYLFFYFLRDIFLSLKILAFNFINFFPCPFNGPFRFQYYQVQLTSLKKQQTWYIVCIDIEIIYLYRPATSTKSNCNWEYNSNFKSGFKSVSCILTFILPMFLKWIIKFWRLKE